MIVKQGGIYKAKRGKIYDDDNPQFNCYSPVFEGEFTIVDCWVCTKDGEIHPGYNVSPVPVYVGYLGKMIGWMDEDECDEEDEYG